MSVEQAAPRRLPHPRYRLPVAGDLLSVDADRPVQREMKMADELGGIYERKIFGHRLVVVSDPELVTLVNNEDDWAKFLALPHRKLRSLAGDGLFTAFNSEPSWQVAHSILGPAFDKKAMRAYHYAMVQSLSGLVSSWDAAPEHHAIDAFTESSKLAFDVIGQCALSHHFESFEQPVPLADAISRTLRYVNRTSNDIPLVRSVTGRGAARQYRADIAMVRASIDNLVTKRISRRIPAGTTDIIDHMLKTPDPRTGEALSTDSIRNQVLTFLIAGNETTASTIGFALHFLAERPELVERLRLEIDEASPDGGPIEFETVAKLRGVRRTIDETLRLWPAAPGYFRKARSKDPVALGGYTLPENWVFVLLPQLHRSAGWGDDSHEFNPDRFAADYPRSKNRVYKPWGTGLRACIGRQFALHESVLALAYILRRYDLTPAEGCGLDIREELTLRPYGVRLKVSRRT